MKNNGITEYFEEVEITKCAGSNNHSNTWQYLRTEKYQSDTPVGGK